MANYSKKEIISSLIACLDPDSIADELLDSLNGHADITVEEDRILLEIVSYDEDDNESKEGTFEIKINKLEEK